MTTIQIISIASIAGKITDLTTGLGIKNAIVAISGTDLTKKTDNDGFYYFTDLLDGTYSITVSVPDSGSIYGKTTISGLIVQSNPSGTPVFDMRANVAIQSTTIEGVIQKNDGTVLAGATISLPGSDIQTVSDVNGLYHLSGLVASNPNVKVGATGFAPEIQQVYLNAGVVTTLNVALHP